MTRAGMEFGRRALLHSAAAASAILLVRPAAYADDPETELVAMLFGRRPAASDQLHLDLPRHFANGYTVPLALGVDSAMTEADHPRAVHIFAPGNPFLRVATFHFTPSSGKAVLSTRIRLAKPQNVIAVAEMSDGQVLMTKSWVEVEIDGCA
jgi:sulfur-oxidizing protein SoxY